MSAKTVKETAVTISLLMQPQDANPAGLVHGGAIMKEIDNASGVVAARHSRKIPVTASIDRIDFHNKVYVGNFVTVKASINHAGRSSMEIGVRVDAEDLLTGELRHVASAYLTFVALGVGANESVPDIIFETDDEKRRNKEAIMRKKAYLALKKIHENDQKARELLRQKLITENLSVE
ncbi:MAG: acyl-CoA thioesterase [Desulfobacteraceae bacterium]|jgi:acyl-CoA hydrolase